MFSRVIPSWEQIRHFKQPLTDGEFHLLKFLDDNLKKDELFQDNDLTKYNGWLIFAQPYLNGCRPDIIIFNPNIGAQIFEVKDWNLNNYFFCTPKSSNLKTPKVFFVTDKKEAYKIKSPIRQVEYYKEKISGQLIPQIGENFDKDNKSFGLIKTAVYFHKSTTEQAQNLFKDQVKNFLKFPVIGNDALLINNLDKIVPDSHIGQNNYWVKDWNKELLFWLNPPFHTIEQNTLLTITDEQKKFAEPQTGHYRVRGVAGSGKTQILAYRATKLASQGYNVLVLSFNITLWHYIHDMAQRSPFPFDWRNLTMTYFHGFCKDILNEFGEVWPIGSAREYKFREVVPKIVIASISKNDYQKYDAILIDEGQDFYIEWYQMLRRFLTVRDEVVIVSDEKQNIYGRDNRWIRRNREDMKQFGDWIELKKIFRLPELVAIISTDFSEKFNLNQDIKIVNIDRLTLFNQVPDHVIWWNICEDNWLYKVNEAYEIIKNNARYKHPSDTVILLPDIDSGWDCVNYFEKEKRLSINHVFEHGFDKKYHRHKKAFWMGDSRLKMSTIHSFKGFEVPNVIVFIPSLFYGDKQLSDNIVYTAITRARENLIVINANERYRKFGEDRSKEWK